MTSNKIRTKFLKYFEKREHQKCLSSSLIPHDDPSVLLTTAGMQQFKKYFLGDADPLKEIGARSITSVQRCFRTSDIEMVGDQTHNTFFEMLGNFSIGSYFKKEAIVLALEFLVKKLSLPKERLWITYFDGDNNIAEDIESRKLWIEIISKDKVIGFGKKDNWWGPPGENGPCGPCSEIHFDRTNKPCHKGQNCRPNCDCGRFVEIWNLVFMQYYQNKKGALKDLPTKNIDTGMGLERIAMIVQNKETIFDTDLFEPLSKVIYEDPSFSSTNQAEDTIRCRVAADHLKATIFLLADGVEFSNKEQGYIARRVFRRALDQYLHTKINLESILETIISIYHDTYPHLHKNKDDILNKMSKEFEAYKKILDIDVASTVNKITNLKEQSKYPNKQSDPSSRKISAEEAFILYSTYGLSPDRIMRKGFSFDIKEFNLKVKEHQKKSRKGAANKFGGHGLDSGEWSDNDKKIITKYHTATHLLHQALREVLGNHVRQQGSDINPQRLRFDFEHPRKLTEEEKDKIEQLVNEKINEKLPVKKDIMDYDEAIDSGSIAFFKEKYPKKVSVYSIGDFSKELCGGPHVKSTGELGTFTIQSEKSSSAGIRRIKAILS